MLNSTKTFPNFLGNIKINKTFLCHVIEHLTRFFRAINLSYMVCPRLMPDKYQYMP